MGNGRRTHQMIEDAGAAAEEAEVWRRRVDLAQPVSTIARELGMSVSTVNRRFRSARERAMESSESTAMEWLTMQVAQTERTIERCEVMIQACVTEKVDEDLGIVTREIDHAAIARYETIRLAAINTLAKLLGTQAATQVEVSGTVTHVDAKDLELAAMLGVADAVESRA